MSSISISRQLIDIRIFCSERKIQRVLSLLKRVDLRLQIPFTEWPFQRAHAYPLHHLLTLRPRGRRVRFEDLFDALKLFLT